MNKIKKSFKIQVFLMITISIATSIIVPTFVSNVVLNKQYSKEQDTILSTLINSCALAIENYVDTYLSGIKTLSQNNDILARDGEEGLANKDREEAFSALQRFNKQYDKFSAVYFGSETNGDTTIFPDFELSVDVRKRPWYGAAVGKNDATISEAYKDSITGETVITLSTPVRDAKGVMRGVLGGDMSMSQLSEFVKIASMDRDETVILVSKSTGMVLASNREDLIGTELPKSTVEEMHTVSESNGLIEFMDRKHLVKTRDNDKLNAALVFLIPKSEMKALLNKQLLASLIVGAIMFLVSVLGSVSGMKPVMYHISDISDALNKVATGDFTNRLETDRADEVGEIVHSYNRMLNNMSNTLSKSIVGLDRIDSASENMSNAVSAMDSATDMVYERCTQIAGGAQEQQAELTRASQVVDTIVDSFDTLQESTQAVSNAYNKAIDLNRIGSDAIGELRVANVQNKAANEQVVSAIAELTASTKKIGTILSAITDIASQTNLLALNASIEAARAGEAGRGFSVVAEEIRKLAVQSEKSVGEISDIIKQTLLESDKTLKTATQIQQVSEREAESVDSVFKAFEQVSGMIDSVAKEVESNTDMVNKLMGLKEELYSSISNVLDIASETASSSNDLATLSEKLASDTKDLGEEAKNVAYDISNVHSELSRLQV